MNSRQLLRNIFICNLIIFSVLGCRQKPEDVVENYLKLTYKEHNLTKAYQLLSSDDKNFKSLEDYVKENKKPFFSEKLAKQYKDKFKYDILQTKVSGDTAVIKVNVTRPEQEDMVQKMVSIAMLTALTSESDDEKQEKLEEELAEMIKEKEVTTISEEKEYTVVRENEDYKIYLNLGLPVKLKRLKAQLKQMDERAAEATRTLKFDEALKIYDRMQDLEYNESVEEKIEKIEKIRKNTVAVGQKLVVGNIEVVPVAVEIRPAKVLKENWEGGKPVEELTPDDYFVLTLKLTNISKGQAFSCFNENRYRKHHTVYDNYGNVMQEFDKGYEIHSIEGNCNKKVKPNEERIVKAVCEPPYSDEADQFLWQFKIFSDNRNSYEFVYVSFNREDITKK